MFYFHKRRITCKPIRRALSLLAAAAVLLTLLPPVPAYAAGSALLRVGLYYGSTAKATFNLANADGFGSGYTFGYYDGDAFVPLGTTQEEYLTVGIDATHYLASGSYYLTKPATESKTIGAYHVQLPARYETYDEAAEVASQIEEAFPAYVDGGFVVRVEFFSATEYAAEYAVNFEGASVVGGSATCVTVMETKTGKILFEFDDPGRSLAVQACFDGKAETYTTGGYRYYGGFEFLRRSGGSLTLVNVVDEDDYVSGVVPYEMSANWPAETLKAGAVAARTYARAATKHKSAGFDVCTTTECQVYRGIFRTSEMARKAVETAAHETTGECVWYDGSLAKELMYFASDGGATESAVNYYGNAVPYLIGKPDPYDDTTLNSARSWSYTVTAQELRTWLSARGYSSGRIVQFYVSAYTDVGNVNAVTLVDEAGETYTFKMDRVRLLNSVNSSIKYFSRCFTIVPEGGTLPTAPDTSSETYYVTDGSAVTECETIYAIDGSGEVYAVSGEVSVMTGNGLTTPGGSSTEPAKPVAGPTGTASKWVISGSGNGHNIGMSQWGAYNMGKQGFTYRDILEFYYTGVTVE